MDVPKVQLQQLFEKEVNRKEFLQHMAAIAIGVIGISALFSRFSQSVDHQAKQSLAGQSSTSPGYGKRYYGR